jgi:SAM-dependent methyltransferase
MNASKVLGLNAMNRTNEVRQMYQEHPFPNPLAGDTLISDQANAIGFLSPRDNLRGQHILDAGCGSGHRLMALAQMFPEAQFTGIDMTQASLATAKALADRHGVRNVRLLQHDLLDPLPEKYDVIISAGVVHHLENPQRGLVNFYSALSHGGFLMLWLYHRYGEFFRLLDRDLALLFWKNINQPTKIGRIELLQKLGLSVPVEHYGTETSRQTEEATQSSIDVDAYMHPIVNAYTFGQIFAMLKFCRVNWIAPNGINWHHHSKLIDLGKTYEDPFFTITAADLFRDKELQMEYERFSPEEKIAAIELAIRPTGFTVLAGRNQSYNLVEPRIGQNLIAM